MKKYKAIFFDWDGTAVINRASPVDEIVSVMKTLLDKKVYLFVISGTTYGNLAGGKLHTYFSPSQLSYLFFGLGRGAYNFSRNEHGKAAYLTPPAVEMDCLLKIHDVAYQLHRYMLEKYSYPTDIIFTRPNYCKIDIMCNASRNESLYLSGNEIENCKKFLESHGYFEGLSGLMRLSERVGSEHGLKIKATCDAKYLEIGVTNKSDNVDILLRKVLSPAGIPADECAFWGDEYLKLDDGIWGSDSFMRTGLSKTGDFFDVGTVHGDRPEYVTYLGGSVKTFLDFLKKQAQ